MHARAPTRGWKLDSNHKESTNGGGGGEIVWESLGPY